MHKTPIEEGRRKQKMFGQASSDARVAQQLGGGGSGGMPPPENFGFLNLLG